MVMNMRKIDSLSNLMAVCSLALLAGLPAFGAVETGIKKPKAGETVEVLVRYATQPKAEQHRRVTDHTGRILETFENVPVGHYEVTPEALADLEANPEVVSISPNLPLGATVDRVTASADYWPLNSYYISLGRGKAPGIGVAILDSGISSTNPNFNLWHTGNSRIVYSQSFVGGDTNDEYGHGTHVAGIAVGTDNVTTVIAKSTRGFGGVAPDANIINLKVLNGSGNGTDASVIAGIDAAISLMSTYNIRVMNLSLGRPITQSYKTDPLCQAVEAAWKAGIVVVVAAGNDGRDNSMGTSGYGTIYAPGNDPYIITVGASNDNGDYERSDDIMTTYSSKGPTVIDHIVKPDLVAPGNLVVSAQSVGSMLVTEYPANQIPTDDYNPAGSSAWSPYFFTLSGTSMATPVVSGGAAMLIDGNPSLTPDQIKAKLMRTAWRGFPSTTTITVTSPAIATYVEYADIFTIGAGQVDIWNAYNDTTLPSGSAVSPAVTINSNGNIQLQFNETSAANVIWGGSSPYATNVIWGTNVSGANVIWGTNAIWGTSATAALNVIWGTNSPWAQSTPGAELLTISINGDN